MKFGGRNITLSDDTKALHHDVYCYYLESIIPLFPFMHEEKRYERKITQIYFLLLGTTGRLLMSKFLKYCTI